MTGPVQDNPNQLSVFIYLPGQLEATYAGEYWHNPEMLRGEFIYAGDYLANKDAVPLDPVSLPLDSGRSYFKNHNGLPGAFRDAMPDYWGRLLLAKEMRCSEYDVPIRELLLAGDGTRVGRLDFRPNRHSPPLDHSVPVLTTLPKLLDTAWQILHDTPDIDQRLVALLRQGGSLGGRRPKCIIEDADGQWLAKFPAPKDKFNVPQLEYATMLLARECGLNVPDVRLDQVGDQDIYLIQRFDRSLIQGALYRHGFISAMSLCNLDDDQAETSSYPEIADNMRQLGMGRDDTKELFRRMVFNIMSRNTDDHLRNHGFIDYGNKSALSPLYDVAPNEVGWHCRDFYMAINVGIAGRVGSILNAVSMAPRFGLSMEDASAECIYMGEAINKHWQRIFSDAGMTDAQIGYFAGAFTRSVDVEAQLAADTRDLLHRGAVPQAGTLSPIPTIDRGESQAGETLVQPPAPSWSGR